ncbi:MAG TPA: hypothetical protein VN841_00910 [Bryobacteraceae bacterium]|nr:hypothetical protein [Bryobacteraceae bacterium]
MPKDAHTNAAYHHERAAKSHRAAAEQSNKGAHEACEQHAVTACDHAAKAAEASKLALEKSVERTKSMAVASK